MKQPNPAREAEKKKEILVFLHKHVFEAILGSNKASESLKTGVRYTIMRMNERDSTGIVQYYWSAVVGTERSTEFARQMRTEGFTRFEEIIEEFRNTFGDKCIRS